MHTALLVLHILLAFALITLILLQQGKGADTGAAFGSGASNTVFGARGAGSFLSRSTAVLAIAFFSNSLVLANLAASQGRDASLMERVQQSSVVNEAADAELPSVPAEPAQAAGDMPDIPAGE